MKHKTALLRLITTSVFLSVFGFIADKDERNTDVLINLSECIIMTVLIFIAISAIYFSLTFTLKKIKQLVN